VSAQTVLKHSNWFPEGQVIAVKVIEPWIAEVAKVTNGRVRIETLPKVVGQRARPVRRGPRWPGRLWWCSSNGYTPGRFDILGNRRAALHGLTRRRCSAPRCTASTPKHVAKYGEYKGVHPLAVFVVAAPQLFNNKRPLHAIGDFKGLKIRSNSAGTTQALRCWAPFPVSKPATETYELMSSGVLDGTVMPPEVDPAVQAGGALELRHDHPRRADQLHPDAGDQRGQVEGAVAGRPRRDHQDLRREFAAQHRLAYITATRHVEAMKKATSRSRPRTPRWWRDEAGAQADGGSWAEKAQKRGVPKPEKRCWMRCAPKWRPWKRALTHAPRTLARRGRCARWKARPRAAAALMLVVLVDVSAATS
jgi:hypothetical protein